MNYKKVLKYILVFVILIGLGYLGYSFLNRPIEVSYVNPSNEDFNETVLGSGRVIPKDYVILSPEISAKITSINIREGDYVNKGQALASLDSSSVDNRVREINASINSANASYESIVSTNYDLAEKERLRLELELENLKREKDRYEILLNEGSIPEIEFTRLEDQFVILEKRLESAKITELSLSQDGTEAKKALSSISQSRANLQSARSDYSKYTISSPISGTVVRLNSSVGEVVQPGQTIVEIADIREKYAYVEVDEKNITKISLGQKAYIYPSSNPDIAVESYVTKISNLVNKETGTVPIEVSIPPESLDLFLIDLSVTVELVINENKDALVLNASYILTEDGKTYILTEDEGIAKKLEITARGTGAKRIISGNVSSSTRVLDPQEINENDKIKIKGEP